LSAIEVRPVESIDFEAWKPLWDGYNAFYEREGAAALMPEITQSTWRRFFDPADPCTPWWPKRRAASPVSLTICSIDAPRE
jgi:hypothetical protein